MIFNFLFLSFCLCLFVPLADCASKGSTLTAPLVLQEGDFLENCVGDRAGVMSGILSVSDGAAPGQFLFQLRNQGQFVAFVVDASGNVFLQRANQQTFLMAQGEGPQNTYRLFLNEKAELTLVSQINEIYFQTQGRDVPRACPVLGCETVPDGDCRRCLSSPDGAKCIYCSKQKTCFASPTFVCPSTDVTFTTVAQCGAATTTTTTTRSIGATSFLSTPPPTPARTPTPTTTLVFKTRAPATGPTFTIRPVELTLAKQLFTQPPEGETSVVDEPSTLQEGVIVGIAVGAALFVCLVLLLMGFLIFRMFRAGNARRRQAMTIANQGYNPHAVAMQTPPQQSFLDMLNQPTPTTAPAATTVAAATATTTVAQSKPYAAEIMFSARDVDPEEPEFQVYGIDNTTIYPASTRKASVATNVAALQRQESATQHYGLSNLGIETLPSQGVTYGLEAQAGSYGAATLLATSGHKPDF